MIKTTERCGLWSLASVGRIGTPRPTCCGSRTYSHATNVIRRGPRSIRRLIGAK